MNYEKLKEKIIHKKSSIDAAAVEIGMSPRGLHSNFSKKNMALETFESLCQILETSPSVFFEEEKNVGTNNVNVGNNIQGNNHQVIQNNEDINYFRNLNSLTDCEKEVRFLQGRLIEKESMLIFMEKLLDKRDKQGQKETEQDIK